jgi:hypothetical protein
MKINLILASSLTILLLQTSCNNKISDKESAEHTQQQDTLTNKKVDIMKSHISIFEIPATDISRAVSFYQSILDIKIEKLDMPEMQMGIFPYEKQMVTGVIIKAEGYKPSADGVTIYCPMPKDTVQQ